MQESAKISIIVPVYGVEKYIGKCIASLCGQTWSNLEIILVDDGSEDGSGKICDDWAEKDKRIRVFHIENGGQSRARNVGMKAATGEYIGFVDADDLVVPEMYAILLALLVENGAQIAECNFTGRKSPESDCMEEKERIVMSGGEAIRRQLDMSVESRYPSTSLWSKLFDAGLLEGRRLPEGFIHEEYAFLCQVFCGCQTYVYLNEKLYCRTLREDSTTAEPFSERTFDKLEVYRQRNRLLLEKGEKQLYAFSRAQEFDLMLFFYGEACRCGITDRAKQLECEMRADRREIFESCLPRERKKKYRLFFISPALYMFLRKVKKG